MNRGQHLLLIYDGSHVLSSVNVFTIGTNNCPGSKATCRICGKPLNVLMTLTSIPFLLKRLVFSLLNSQQQIGLHILNGNPNWALGQLAALACVIHTHTPSYERMTNSKFVCQVCDMPTIGPDFYLFYCSVKHYSYRVPHHIYGY